jgi:hypothetical protein
MINRVTSLLIGKDIDRSAGVVAGEAYVAYADGANALASGELVVLDKNLKVLAPGATIADTDMIYVAQGTSTTFDVGSLTGIREILLSEPIQGSKVKSYIAEGYTVKAEQVSTTDFTGLTPVVGTEYIIRIIYKDITETPSQFTQSYRYISTTATLSVWLTAVVAKINAHSGRRVNATEASNTDLILTGRAITECTTALTDIDPFTMVEFSQVNNYVDSSGNRETILSTSSAVTTVAAVRGSGNWEQVRDIEKSIRSNRGVTNITHFPVIAPASETVVDATYNEVIVEHDKSYQSPDNAYVKETKLTTVLAFVVPSAGTQQSTVLSQLNPWFASLPGAFANISF